MGTRVSTNSSKVRPAEPFFQDKNYLFLVLLPK